MRTRTPRRRAPAPAAPPRRRPPRAPREEPPGGDPGDPAATVAALREQLALQTAASAQAAQTAELWRQRYTDLFDFAPIGYATLDRQGVIRAINLAGAALLGSSRAACVGHPLRAWVVAADQRSWRAHLAQAVASAGQATTTLTLRHVDGGPRVVQVTSQAVGGADGTPYLPTTLLDVTARTQAEAALRASQRTLQAAFASIGEAIFIADAGGRLTEFNEEFVRYHRFRDRGECSTTIAECPESLDAFFPDGTPAPLEMWAMPRALRGETASNVEYMLRRKDTGETWWGSYSFGPIKDPDGRIVGAVVAAREITALARRRAWDQAKGAIGAAAVSGAPLDAVLTAALDAMAAAAGGAAVGAIRLVDRETGDLLLAAERNLPPGYRREARRLTRDAAHVAGEVAATGTARLVPDAAAEPGLAPLATLFTPPLGAAVCVPLKFHDVVLGTLALGHPTRLGLGPADLTELQACADMLAGAIRADQLRTALRVEAAHRTLLLRELDHRVRNSLATLIGLLHLTAEDAGAPAERILRATADRVARLADVHAVLAADGHARADLGQIVQRIAGAVFDGGPAGRIRWAVTVPPLALDAGPAANLALVLHELFTNAVKHAFPGGASGTVTVEGRQDGRTLHLTVTDDGPGLAVDARPGTGLTIVETLVTHSLRGRLWVTAARDGGCLAHLRLPLPDDGPPPAPA